MRGLRLFVEDWVSRNLTPLDANCDVSVATWLRENGTYTATRKKELAKVWDQCLGDITKSDYMVKLFTKTETYGAYKHARGINSRSDAAKCMFGPYFHRIEEVVYKHPAFIKHVPFRERPAYIMKMLGHFPGPFVETDYTAFESHFTAEVMECLEMVLYGHMLRNFPVALRHIRAAMLGDNKCYNKHFRIVVDARRMSGEMCTSLGNGFSNLMLAMYVAHTKGADIVGVVEGDDGLFYCNAPITSDDFLRLGFRIKMLTHDDVLEASFCGLIMSRDLCTMTDPFDTIIGFGWTHSVMRMAGARVRMQLLRAKALSLAYEHPRCPILSTLAIAVLRWTDGVKPLFETNWYSSSLNSQVTRFREDTDRLLSLGPSLQTRIDFARIFGVSLEEQRAVEGELMKWQGGPLGPLVTHMCSRVHRDVSHYSCNYVRGRPYY